MHLAFTIRFWFWLWNLGLLIFFNKKGTTKLKSVLARTKQDISSVKCPYKAMSNKKVRPTPLGVASVLWWHAGRGRPLITHGLAPPPSKFFCLTAILRSSDAPCMMIQHCYGTMFWVEISKHLLVQSQVQRSIQSSLAGTESFWHSM